MLVTSRDAAFVSTRRLTCVALALDGRHDRSGDAVTDIRIEIEPLVKALDRLEALDARQAEVVKMRVVWGMEVAEIADALGLSASTVKRDWRFARAWLMEEASRY